MYVEEYRKREQIFLNSVVRKKTDREIEREIYITPKYDAEYLVKAGRVTEKGIRDAIQRVCLLARPVILAADGYPLMDDCGETDGYVDTLRSIEDGDKDSKAWAESMGWKKKIDKSVL